MIDSENFSINGIIIHVFQNRDAKQLDWKKYGINYVIDATGSYLTTYITTIGLYDDDDNLLVVAKLPKPIKNLPDYNLNFLVRFDT